jgi:predicted aspartyl protease
MDEIKLIVEPDEEEPGAAAVFVDGMIGGHPYRFLLDTGAATTSVLTDDYLAAFDSLETKDSSGVFAPHSDDLITVPRIDVGPISKTDVTVARVATTNADIRNLIGMDLLKNFCCHFLFDEGRVLVSDDAGCSAGYDLRPLLLGRKFHPYVDVRLGPVTGQAVWDTGASITIVDMNFINAHPAFFQPAGHSTGTDSTGAQMETPMYMIAAPVIGGVTFSPHRVAGVDLSPVNATIDVPMDLILGYTTLSQANWVFDFPRKKWAISKRLGS